MKENKQDKKGKKPLYKRVLRVLGWVVLSIIGLLVLVWILIQLPPVQNFARKKLVNYLHNKIHTRVEIGKVELNFPTAISLQDVFLEDQKEDTLLYGNKITVDISMLRLLAGKVNIKEINLDGIVGKVKRLAPDSVFNFQYIIDAFASKETSKPSKKEDSSPMEIDIHTIVLNHSHIIYKDDPTGNDLDLRIGHFNTEIKTFDIPHLLFNISTIEAKQVSGHFYQLEPLQKEVTDVIGENAQKEDKSLQLINKEIKLSDINFQFNSEPSHLKSSYIIGNATLRPEKLDLKNMLFSMKEATLENSHIQIATDRSKVNIPAKDTVSTAPPPPGITVLTKKITIKNSSFKFDDESQPRIPKGIDYAHLNLTDITVKGEDVRYSGDTTHAILTSATLKDQSGFVLNNMQVEFTMTSSGISLKNMMIKTPGSLLRKSVSIHYPSLEVLSKDPGLLSMDIDLEKSRLSIKDLLLFLPDLGKQISLSPEETIYVDTRITGTVGKMNIQRLTLHGLSATNISLKGSISGLPDPEKMVANLDVQQFKTSEKDIKALLPANTVPANITFPDHLALTGRFHGGMKNMETDLQLSSPLGNATLQGTAADLSDQKDATYDLKISASKIQLNHILQNPELGLLSGTFNIKGKGLDPKTAHTTFRVDLPVVTYHQYTYRNIQASGNLENARYQLNTSVDDPNLSVKMEASGMLKNTYPTLKLKGTIDSIRTLPLHFTQDVLKYHGNVFADFSNLNPDSLNGKLIVSNSILFNKHNRMVLDTLQLIAGTGVEDSLILISSPASFALKGKYKLSQLGTIFQQAIDPYFSVSTLADSVSLAPYHFTVQGNLMENPAIKTFMPKLKNMKPINLQGAFSSDSGWHLTVQAPHINYDSMVINDVNFRVGTDDSMLAFSASMGRLHSGTSMDVYQTRLDGTVAHNKLNFALNIRDALSKNKYHLEGELQKSDTADYVFSLSPDSLLLNYDNWKSAPKNSITYKNGNIYASGFKLSNNGQGLSLESQGNTLQNPLRISFTDFKLATLTGFVQPDSTKINGILNGSAVIRDLSTDPVFTADLMVTDLSMYQDTLGNLSAKVHNNNENQYHAEISLEGRGNDLKVSGDYFTKPSGSSFDFVANFNRFQMSSLEGLTQGAIRDGRGYVFGKVSIKGTTDKPEINGNIKFHNTSFVPVVLNNVFKIDKESVALIQNKGILLHTFTIRDTNNNKLVLTGSVLTDDWTNFRFDLGIKANHFQAINSTAKDNELFYGKMIFSTNLTIKGTPAHPVVDGSLVINKNTEFSIVIPQEAPGIARRKGIVRFVDYSAKAEDSLFMAPYDSLKQAPLVGYDVSLNISIEKEATFNVVVDEANGDFLQLQGTGQLTGGIDASGKITLAGTYEIEKGSYSLSFNFLKRKFLIQKGSKITWTGEPMTAQLDLTAIYVANTPPYNLVQDLMETVPVTFKQKLPFSVNLHMEGELLKPVISFDIVLPDDKNYLVGADVISTTRDRLAQLRQDPDEMNKQVFALLLLNRFVGQNPFESGSSSMSATTFAKQSVSRLLSEQLNNLTEGLIAGVDFNFDLATSEDYTTGAKKDRTDLNVGVTKNLFNNRLSVTVGSNFELEGPQVSKGQQNNLAGNISINYKLSKDGRYMLRAYRKNDFTGVVEGYVVETGVAFLITLDYNKLREIFHSREKRKQKRKIRKRNKQMTEQNEENTQENKPTENP